MKSSRARLYSAGLSSVLLGILLFCWLHAAPHGECRRVVILQSSDTHCAFGDTRSSRGSWLQLASTIAIETRNAGGAENCLLVDCGDTLQGSLAGRLSKGKAAVDALAYCGYDAFIPGNHDFDFGLDTLNAALDKLAPIPVCGNLRFDCARDIPLPAWRLFVKNKVRIALIGMTSPRLDFWLWGGNRKGFEVETLSETLDRVMPEVIAAKPDVTILAVHHPLRSQHRFPAGDDLAGLCRKYPQINVVLGGHSHQVVSGEKLSHGTWFIQPGEHGEYLSKVVLDVDLTHKRPPMAAFELVPTSGAEPDPGLAQRVAGVLTKAAELRETPLGVIPRITREDGNAERLLARRGVASAAMASSSNAAIAVLSQAIALPSAGEPLTYGVLFDALPYEDTIAVLSLTKAELTEVLTEMREVARRNSSMLEVHGVELLIRRAGERVEVVVVDGSGWGETERRRVAFSGYDLAGAGNRLPCLRSLVRKPEAAALDTGVAVREAVRFYVKQPPVVAEL